MGFSLSAADSELVLTAGAKPQLGLKEWQHLGTAPDLAMIASLNCDFEGHRCAWVLPFLSPIKFLPHLFLQRVGGKSLLLLHLYQPEDTAIF